MLNRKLFALIIILAVLAVPAAAALVFFARSPVLMVSDAQFAALYGINREKKERLLASITLFRSVKSVAIADGASPDIVAATIAGVAEKPYCVLFPGYYLSAAAHYHEEFPEIPVVLFAGNAAARGLPEPDDFLSICRIDTGTDLYRAGLMAGILGKKNDSGEQEEHEGMSVVLWQHRSLPETERALFTGGVYEVSPDLGVVFARNASDIPNAAGLSCVALGSIGAEYFDKNFRVPLILFTWLDPDLTPKEAAVIFDDSPWALAVPSVRLALQNGGEIKIPSKPLIFSDKVADNGIFRILKGAAKKTP
jgi:hypothetical protein